MPCQIFKENCHLRKRYFFAMVLELILPWSMLQLCRMLAKENVNFAGQKKSRLAMAINLNIFQDHVGTFAMGINVKMNHGK